MTHTPDSKAGAENAIAAHLDRTTEGMMLLADELAKLRAVSADNEIRVLEITERMFALTERAKDGINDLIRETQGAHTLAKRDMPKPSLAIVGGRDVQQYQRLDMPRNPSPAV